MEKIGQISIFVIIGIIIILAAVAGFFMFGNGSTEEDHEHEVDDVHNDGSTEEDHEHEVDDVHNDGSTEEDHEQSSENMGETIEPQTYDIEIKSHAFSPKTLTIKKDDMVVWINMDSSKHTVTSDSGNELDSVLLSKQGTYSHIFNKVGTYNYTCSVHSNMKGTIIVE